MGQIRPPSIHENTNRRRQYVSRAVFLLVLLLLIYARNEYSDDSASNLLQLAPSSASSQNATETSSSIIMRPPLFIKKVSGTNWTLWDRSSPIIVGPDIMNCDWTTFRSSVSRIKLPMCVHPGKDIVSGTIRRKKRWEDCDNLSTLWKERQYNSKTTTAIHIEIGANIGACVMELLTETTATIVAFEPHPKNQFCLTSTLMGLEEHYRNRVGYFR